MFGYLIYAGVAVESIDLYRSVGLCWHAVEEAIKYEIYWWWMEWWNLHNNDV